MSRSVKYLWCSVIVLFLCTCIFYEGFFVLDDRSAVISPENKIVKGTGIYLINIDDSVGRLEYVMPSIMKLGLPVLRVPGVDGRNISAKDIEDKVDANSYRRYIGRIPRNGTIGCSLSHFEVWRRFLESNYEFALVLEDDVSFPPKRLSEAVRDLTKIPQLWDIVSFEINHSGAPVVIKHLTESDSSLVVYLFDVTHTGSYLINRKAAAKLLAKALPIKLPVDHYFTRSWELGTKFLGVEPRLVTQSYGQSDIAETGFFDENLANIRGFSLSKSIYKFKSSVIRLLYNMWLYASLKMS